MKSVAIGLTILLALSSTACRVERTDDNVVVTTDTREAREEAAETTSKVKEGLSDAAEATETALREGARRTGTALEKAGKEIQEHSKPGNQP